MATYLGLKYDFCVILVIFLACVLIQPSNSSDRRHFEECILFKGNDSYASQVSESYLEMGYFDVPKDRDFEISFEVLPSASDHDGPLFAIGTEDFAYYEWKTKAVKTQFLVVEFFYSAISMLLKALNHEHMVQVEIHRTHPHIYVLNDVRWHEVRAARQVPSDGSPQTWILEMDHLTEVRNMTSVIDVDMFDCKAYLGGRPGYRSSQFRGVIRDLFINGERVHLRGKATYGLTEVWHCTAPEVRNFIQELRDEVEMDQWPRRRRMRERHQTPNEEEEEEDDEDDTEH